jgi:enterochelin esterase family protein
MTNSGIMEAFQTHPPQVDPLNLRQYGGQSYVELPDAPAQPWVVERPDVPHGTFTDTKIKSETLNAERPLRVYLPPGYENGKERCWLMIAFDSGFNDMERTLDNLRAAGKIPPIVVVGVSNLSQDSRNKDLDGSDAFATFLAKELVPWARKTYRVYDDASRTIVGGVSLGGFMAIYCGLTHSDVFGEVLAQSPTLIGVPGQIEPKPIWEAESPGMMPLRFAESRRLPLKFYLEAGRYEVFLPFSLLTQTRRLRDVLIAKGYPVTYDESPGGHNEVNWRGSFANAVMALTKTKKR